MDLALIFVSFFAGILTVLAPCVLPILPIIIGGSLGGNDKSRPFFIILGLAFSVTLFTILLKATTLLINVPEIQFPFRVMGAPPFITVWQLISALLVLFFGFTYVFPRQWDAISLRLGLSKKSDSALENAGQREGVVGALLIGAALGPVFASCSPTYSLIIATVLPVNFLQGMGYIIIYALGLSLVLGLISALGRRFVSKIQGLSNPDGAFRKILGLIFIIVGLSILTGFDKVTQVKLTDFTVNNGLDVGQLEQKLFGKTIDDASTKNAGGIKKITVVQGADLNVNPVRKAPEFTKIDSWINSNGETMANLKGKVVLVDFWTYSCINCVRTVPYISKWYETYKDQGFVAVGVHAPEFAFEQKRENVQRATESMSIKYPVALDNQFGTWGAYLNSFWPASYLIDADGNIRRFHAGEGEYDVMEKSIKALLAEKNGSVSDTAVSDVVKSDTGTGKFCENGVCTTQSPETYTGYARIEGAKNRVGDTQITKDADTKYTSSNMLESSQWTLGGNWNIQKEQAVAGENAIITYKINAKKMYAVLQTMDMGSKVRIEIHDANGMIVGQPNEGIILVTKSGDLYTLVNSASFLKDATVTLKFDKGVAINAFTFG